MYAVTHVGELHSYTFGSEMGAVQSVKSMTSAPGGTFGATA
jgi:hypothetical protein